MAGPALAATRTWADAGDIASAFMGVMNPPTTMAVNAVELGGQYTDSATDGSPRLVASRDSELAWLDGVTIATGDASSP